MSFSNIDLADNAFVGGILGFVEEAMEDGRFGENDDIKLTAEDIKVEDLEDGYLKLLYNQDPDFVIYLVNKFIQHKKISPVNQKFKAIMAEIEEEIEQMEREEENGDDK